MRRWIHRVRGRVWQELFIALGLSVAMVGLLYVDANGEQPARQGLDRPGPVTQGSDRQGPVTSAPDPEHGKVLAKQLCSGCHLVAQSQRSAVVDVPTFAEIANRPEQTPGAIMARIIIPKHPMPVIPITKAELKDLAAYVMSLRRQ